MQVLLADDQPEVRSALRLLLEEEPFFEVVADVACVAELMAEAATKSPQLVLLDWELPGTPGAHGRSEAAGKRLVSELRTVCPQVKVVALSGRLEARGEAIEAGVDGFISKGESPERLLATLRVVCDGSGSE